MLIRKLTQSLLTVALAGALCFGYAAFAAERTPATGGAKLSVAKVDGRKAFMGSKKGEGMKNLFNSLSQEYQAARQVGDNDKAGRIQRQFESMQEAIRHLVVDAVGSVAHDKQVDIVVGVRYAQDGASDLELVYKPAGFDLPDLTMDVTSRINSLAATRPALDSQPASGPSSAPSLNLTPRAPIQLAPPKSK